MMPPQHATSPLRGCYGALQPTPRLMYHVATVVFLHAVIRHVRYTFAPPAEDEAAASVGCTYAVTAFIRARLTLVAVMVYALLARRYFADADTVVCFRAAA